MTTTKTAQIKITWQAFGNSPQRNRFVSSVEFKFNHIGSKITDQKLCDKIYQDTNLYSGLIWDIVEPLLSPTRTHTALSVGDEIQINENAYIVADFGFIKKENAKFNYAGNAIFSVSEKVGA
jgi:hypothetical protein